MSGGQFMVGLVISTVNVSLILRQIKYRSELLAYGYSEENRPFSSSTPFTDAKDYRLVFFIYFFIFLFIYFLFLIIFNRKCGIK